MSTIQRGGFPASQRGQCAGACRVPPRRGGGWSSNRASEPAENAASFPIRTGFARKRGGFLRPRCAAAHVGTGAATPPRDPSHPCRRSSTPERGVRCTEEPVFGQSQRRSESRLDRGRSAGASRGLAQGPLGSARSSGGIPDVLPNRTQSRESSQEARSGRASDRAEARQPCVGACKDRRPRKVDRNGPRFRR